jgi:predicted MFS family arabinose efflux permease
MLCCDTLRWLASGSVPLFLIAGWLSIPQLALVVFVEGTANVFFSVAQLSALPHVVTQEQVALAYGLDQTAESMATLLGPGLSGFIIGVARTKIFGASFAYLVDSISYLVSVISLLFIRVQFQTERIIKQKSHLWTDIRQGMSFLWQQQLLRALALLTMAVNFFQAATPLALIVLMQNQLNLSVSSIGLVFSAGGIGGLVGGLIAPWIKQWLRLGHILLGSIIIWALAAVLLAVGTNVPMFMGSMLLIYLTWPVYAVAVVSYRLSIVPDELQGRINSSFRMLTYGCESLGPAVGGLFLTLLAPRAELATVAAGLGGCFVVAACTSLRKA